MAIFGSFGASKSKSQQQSQSQQSAISSNLLFEPQRKSQTLANIAGRNLVMKTQPQIAQLAPALAGSLGGQGQGFLDSLGGQSNQFINQLGAFQGGGQQVGGVQAGGAGNLQQLAGGQGLGLGAGGQALQGIAGGQFDQGNFQENPFLDQQIGNLGEDINTQLQRQGVGRGQAQQGAGQFGGSRGQIAEGLAQEAALREFQQGAGGLRAQDASQRQLLQEQARQFNVGSQLQAGGALGSLQQGAQGLRTQAALGAADQGLGQAGLDQAGQLANQQAQLQGQGLDLAALQSAAGQQNQFNQGQTGAAQAGLGSLGNLFNLGIGGLTAQFGPLQALAGLSAPILQGRSSSQGSSSGFGSSSSSSFNIGF